MKLYITDLRPGDEFDALELIDRIGICTTQFVKDAASANPAKVISSLSWGYIGLIDIDFEMGGEHYTWAFCENQVVEMRKW